MYLSKITDYDISNLSANNPAAGAVDMWVTGQFQLSTYPSAHKYYGDIFAEQLGVTLSLTYDTLHDRKGTTSVLPSREESAIWVLI
jgi:hypothetical protein